MKEPILIILSLFILIGFAYGPLKNSSLNKKSELNGASSLGAPTENISNSTNKTYLANQSYSTNQDIAKEIKKTEKELEKIEKEINKEIEESKRSPYYGKIRMSSVSGLHSESPDRQYISLYTSLKENETLKITGWYFKSEITGYYAVIGKASLLPFPFTKTESDVILQKGDRVYITKGFSPIGISFRTNKCTGFFEENRTFYPRLSLQCPRPKDEKLPIFSNIQDRNDECLDIIERIGRCTTKGNEFVRDLPDTVTSSCKNYITNQINYNTCVANHFGDTDFPGNEYRIYLNRFGTLWREEREKITLYDENNLVVDSISY